MSHSIYRSFSVKNGKWRYNAAESNVFDVHRGSNGREYQSYCFHKGERDLKVDEPTITSADGSSRSNPYYGLSDIQIYANFMLQSVFCGDRFYQNKHKFTLRAASEWADAKTQADVERFATAYNILPDTVLKEYWSKEFRDKYPGFDYYRIHKPTKVEMDELVTVIENAIVNYRAAEKQKQTRRQRSKYA
jgi:hypothetical protein